MVFGLILPSGLRKRRRAQACRTHSKTLSRSLERQANPSPPLAKKPPCPPLKASPARLSPPANTLTAEPIPTPKPLKTRFIPLLESE
jgi:hypothetical protein